MIQRHRVSFQRIRRNGTFVRGRCLLGATDTAVPPQACKLLFVPTLMCVNHLSANESSGQDFVCKCVSVYVPSTAEILSVGFVRETPQSEKRAHEQVFRLQCRPCPCCLVQPPVHQIQIRQVELCPRGPQLLQAVYQCDLVDTPPVQDTVVADDPPNAARGQHSQQRTISRVSHWTTGWPRTQSLQETR